MAQVMQEMDRKRALSPTATASALLPVTSARDAGDGDGVAVASSVPDFDNAPAGANDVTVARVTPTVATVAAAPTDDPPRRRRRLPHTPRALRVFYTWLQRFEKNPYPSRIAGQTEWLMEAAGVKDRNRVLDWFSNVRSPRRGQWSLETGIKPALRRKMAPLLLPNPIAG